jgi:outer membrane receptor protein involved in Fe transport
MGMLTYALAFWIVVSPQAPRTGVVTGSIFDANTAGVVRGADIEVEGNPAKHTVTDINGSFRLELPPGRYRLKLSTPNYLDASIDVVVVEGKIVDASGVMTNKETAGASVDVVEAVGAVEATAQAMLVERKLAPAVSDSISKEEIKESVASNAAAAVEKVTGVSIVDDGYVYVRGLGERYSATMLNNAMLPTTDPERRVVPLDMFPSSLIDNIKVLKTYTPDLPGEFSGGLVQMHTVEFPSRRTLTFGFSNSFNSLTTFKPFSTYDGGKRDFWGFDDGTRDLPSMIPTGDRIFPGHFTEQEIQSLGRSFAVNWEPATIQSMRPAQGFSIAGGNTFRGLGLTGAVTFSNAPSTRSEKQLYLSNIGNNQAGIFTQYDTFITSTETAKMGGVLNAAFRLTPNNKIVFRNTFTHDAEKEARLIEGENGGISTYIQSTRLRWVERGLYSGGLQGEHSVPALHNSLLGWQITYSRSTRHEPDLREVVRGRYDDGRYSFLSNGNSGQRFFNNLRDRIYEPAGDWLLPFFGHGISGSLKIGFRGTVRRRDFDARRFRFLAVNASTLDFFLPSNQLLSPDNIRSNGFEIRENTRGTDKYDGEMDIYGSYAMLDITLGPRLRLVGGGRFEDAKIKVITEDPLVPGSIPAVSSLNNRDVLPGLNVIYAMSEKQNLRFGFGRTLSRPDFRELSPFDFTNVLGGYNTVGNPKLRRAIIDNYDARWEWFFGGDQLAAVSYFLKDFTDAIEVTIQPTTDLRQSFVNAAGARNQGIELELRRNLRFLGEAFTPFSIQSNFTFVDSNVELNRDDAVLLTSKSRPLVGQSRFIYNIAAEWTKPSWRSQARFFVNSVSKRITDVGTFGLPDVYQKGNTTLDFAYQFQVRGDGKWNLRFTGENLNNSQNQWTQGNFVQRSYRPGRTFSLGTTLSLF